MGATLETDYLVVGTGAAGMAFTDSLLSQSDATVTLIDRRHAPGSHWLPSITYPLGSGEYQRCWKSTSFVSRF